MVISVLFRNKHVFSNKKQKIKLTKSFSSVEVWLNRLIVQLDSSWDKAGV